MIEETWIKDRSGVAGQNLAPFVTSTIDVPVRVDLGKPPVDALETTQPATDSEIYQISGELPGGGWLQGPLSVQVFLEQGEFVARQPQTGLTAFGETPVDALYALGQELVDVLRRLEAAADSLAPRLVRQRDLLRYIVSFPSDAQH